MSEINHKEPVEVKPPEHHLADNLEKCASIVRIGGSLIPHPGAKVITETAGTLLEAGANIKRFFDENADKKDGEKRRLVDARGELAGTLGKNSDGSFQ